MGIIKVSGIKLHGFHGCLAEEAMIGGEFIIDVIIDTDFSKAEVSDKLSDTVDYCTVYNIVKAEMAIRSKLIEEVCRRILNKLQASFPKAVFEVTLTKLHPPMNGDVESVSVILKS